MVYFTHNDYITELRKLQAFLIPSSVTFCYENDLAHYFFT